MTEIRFKAAAKGVHARFKEIEVLGLQVYTPAGFRAFLHDPQPAFGGKSAGELIDAGEFETVMSALAADYEGLGF